MYLFAFYPEIQDDYQKWCENFFGIFQDRVQEFEAIQATVQALPEKNYPCLSNAKYLSFTTS